jgi:hypothetical protein
VTRDLQTHYRTTANYSKKLENFRVPQITNFELFYLIFRCSIETIHLKTERAGIFSRRTRLAKSRDSASSEHVITQIECAGKRVHAASAATLGRQSDYYFILFLLRGERARAGTAAQPA